VHYFNNSIYNYEDSFEGIAAGFAASQGDGKKFEEHQYQRTDHTTNS